MGAREEASTDMGHSEGFEVVGVQDEERLVLSRRAPKEGADEVAPTEDRSLKTEKAALEEVELLDVKVDRVDCLRTLATEERRELEQVVRCARDAICFCFGEGFLESTRTLKGLV
jgi:hypothetical protein